MRGEKGITLISLVSYVAVLLIVVSSITLITNFFINNINEVEDDSKNVSEINKFDSAFLKDIKQEGISIYKIGDDAKSIVLENQNMGIDIQYIYQSGKIYRIENGIEKIEINDEIKEFYVSLSEDNIVTITIEVEEYKSEKSYKLGKY